MMLCRLSGVVRLLRRMQPWPRRPFRQVSPRIQWDPGRLRERVDRASQRTVYGVNDIRTGYVCTCMRPRTRSVRA